MDESGDLENTSANDQNLATQNLPNDIDRRLSVLEERTKPKPKTLVDHITQWGGVATFLLAFVYTFPLGVWDRFFVTPVESERSLIAKLTDVDTEYFKVSQTLPMDQMFAISMSMRAKKMALLLPSKESILRWKGSLSGAEVELLAYHAGSVGEVELAKVLYQTSLTKADAEKNPFLAADIYRMLAQLFAAPGTAATSPTKARENYNEAVNRYVGLAQTYPASIAAWDWANLEVAQGSKPCAYLLAQWAIRAVDPLDKRRAQEWTQILETQRAADAAANALPRGPCEKDKVRLTNISPSPMSGPASPGSPSVNAARTAPNR
jgi:hypothetical protein